MKPWRDPGETIVNKDTAQVYLSGSGLACASGDSIDVVCRRICDGEVRHQLLEIDWFAESFSLPWYDIASAEKSDSYSSILDKVVSDAFAEVDLSDQQKKRLGIFLGSSSFEIGASEKSYEQELKVHGAESAMPMQLVSYGNITARLRRKFSLSGPDYIYGTACSASANALLGAQRLLQAGVLDHALVIGLETYNLTTLSGFQSMQLISQDEIRPFDQKRSGMILGEGCAAVLLTRLEPSSDDIGETLRISGGASRCDTSSVTSTADDGSAIALVMRQAMLDCDLTTADITAIKAHGTASLANDRAEAAGLHSLFSRMPTLFSLKPFLGHTLGACGVLELVCLDGLLRLDTIPATPGFEQSDPELLVTPSTQSIDVSGPAHFMLNHFGFGGNNTVLIASRG